MTRCKSLGPDRRRCAREASHASGYCQEHRSQPPVEEGDGGAIGRAVRRLASALRLDSPSSRRVRDDATLPLPSSYDSKSLEELTHLLLNDPSSLTRWHAALALRKRRDPRAIEALWQALSHERVSWVRQQCAVAIDGDATGNAIQGSAIFSNTGLGIDLEDDDVTSNDASDGDMGTNNLQNFPVLTSAITGTITIEGMLNSTPDATFRLEFFSNSACDPSDHGEGETFLGSLDMTTDSQGDVEFTVTFTASVPAGHFVTATATDPDSNTSEFSRCMMVLACPDVQPPAGVDAGDIQAVAARWRLTAQNPNPDNDLNTPNYEARYDVVFDGAINIQDVMAVAAHWGKTCS